MKKWLIIVPIAYILYELYTRNKKEEKVEVCNKKAEDCKRKED